MTPEGLINTVDILAAAIFGLAGVVGMFSHWFKRWIRAEVKVSLFDYLFTKNSRYTLYAFFSYAGVMAGLFQIGIDNYISSESLILSFMAGYNIDSVVNKDVKSGIASESVMTEFKSK